MEGLCKRYGITLIASSEVLQAALNQSTHPITHRPLEEVIVKGRSASITVHEVLVNPDPVVHEMANEFTSLFTASKQSETDWTHRLVYDQYKAKVEGYVEKYPKDAAGRLLLEKVKKREIGKPTKLNEK
jgi:hypothetical protein